MSNAKDSVEVDGFEVFPRGLEECPDCKGSGLEKSDFVAGTVSVEEAEVMVKNLECEGCQSTITVLGEFGLDFEDFREMIRENQ